MMKMLPIRMLNVRTQGIVIDPLVLVSALKGSLVALVNVRPVLTVVQDMDYVLQ